MGGRVFCGAVMKGLSRRTIGSRPTLQAYMQTNYHMASVTLSEDVG